jgi:hypothetical protein
MVFESERSVIVLHGGSGSRLLSDTWELRTDPFSLGDLNCDCSVNAFDIEPFITAMIDPAGYAAAYPDCQLALADANGDGSINSFDIEPFIALLLEP